MLTLNDGRSELWQWDTKRKLTVDADCSQVHFSNNVFGRSIDVDVVDGVAIIPDVLLQTDKELTAWAFVGTPENGYTKISKVFNVNRRNKPADYVFTPPDQTTLGELVERLGKIEESQDPDAIKNAVDDYLANNPIMVKETDPTVPEWAKYPTKPSYTAAEVGAQPAGNYLTEIEIKPVIEAANSAQALAKQADKKVDTLREVVSKFHSNIVEEAKGDIITLDDASDMELAGLTLYGKTTQNGTPTPEAPIPLESVGADGNVVVSVCGKNLLDCSGLTAQTVNGVVFTPVYENGLLQHINVNGTASGNTTYDCASAIPLKSGNLVNGCPSGGSGSSYYLRAIGTDYQDGVIDTGSGATIAKDKNFNVQIYIVGGYTANNLKFYPMVRLASVTDATYEPYKESQTLTVQTPNGLPGIPVSSGGNYTDENGQQWICDEIDFARGKYVQRVRKKSFKGMTCTRHNTAENRMNFYFYHAEAGIADVDPTLKTYPLCNAFRPVNWSAFTTTPLVDGQMTVNGDSILFRKLDCTSLDEFNNYLANNEVNVLYKLASPIETDLTAEELAAYAALHTNYPNTTIYNDEGAGMAVKYVADTKLYIDNKFTELQNAILSAGANV